MMKANTDKSTNGINLFLNSTLQESIDILLSDLPKEKIEDLLKVIRAQNDYINSLFEKMRKLGLFINDVENNKVFPNDLWYKLGYTEDDMLNVGFLELIHPDDLQKVKDQSILPSSRGEDVNKIVFRFRSKGGSWHWLVSSTVSITTDNRGYVKQYVGFDSDITEEMETKVLLEKALIQAEASAVEANTLREVGKIITSALDFDSTIGAIMDQAKNVIPYDTASVQIIEDDHLVIVGGGGWEEPEKVIGIKFSISGDNSNSTVAAIMKNKKPIIIEDLSKVPSSLEKLTPEFNSLSWLGIPLLMRNKVIGLITFDKHEKEFFTDNHIKLGITLASHVAIALENARIYEEVKELAAIDPLTGVHNRRSFFAYALQQEKFYKRYGTEFSIIMLDIDNFKKINDEYGHQPGDKVLISLVTLIKKGLRDSDFLCRYGGEEFVILLPRSDESEAYDIAERIRKSVKSNLKIEGVNTIITVSIGCADLRAPEAGDVDSLILIADKALYYAKNNGRDQSQRFSSIVK